MSQHKTGYVISYHGILCHDMSYVTTITASLARVCMYVYVQVCDVIVHSLFTGTFTRRQTDMYMVDQKLKAVEFQGQ